ncbi:hypothetical protein C8J56DRAFT_791635 [Mycena floridula]|nr:hypothetical protein C8J56DRAFT_791635 [Mycena floridula]
MGNSSSSSSGRGQQDDTVDLGHLSPQGIYTGPRDWNQAIVTQLICARKLAPFYRPLEDYEDSWDDDQILAARKEPPDVDRSDLEQTTTTRIEATASSSNNVKANHNKRPSTLKEPSKPEAAVYRGAVECPICFLYYPPNINHSRCCGQAICTECFVQIKRSEPTTTHLVSEPAACPYCVQDNFGIVYNPPSWRAGLGSDGTNSPWSDSPKGTQLVFEQSSIHPTHKRRQKSFGADSPEVVTTDQIRPDWEAKLAAVQAAVTRRANRRIIMRQVGDRLIPVGVTSGRVHPLSLEEAAAEAESGGSRRSRRRQQQTPITPGFEQYLGLGGQDLEELMMMEAMRLSLLDHEEQQKKQAEEKKKNAANQTGSVAGPSSAAATSSAVSSSSPATPSSAPTHQSKDSLSAKSNFFTRSRSPSPGASETGHGSQSDTWLRRSSNPPPFSTLSAALSATSTATALLAGASASSEPSTPSSNETAPIPTITVGSSSEPQSRPILPLQDSQASSIFSSDAQTDPSLLYQQIPSSSELFQPLIPAEGTSTPKIPSLPAEDEHSSAR